MNTNETPKVDGVQVSPNEYVHTVVSDKATCEVHSIYEGEITLLELIKQMIKRDIEMLDR